MNKRIGWSIVALLVIVVLAVTNPSEDQHKERLYARVSEEPESFWAIVGLSVAESFGFSVFHYRNRLLFSVLQMEDNIVTFGILDNVLIVEDL